MAKRLSWVDYGKGFTIFLVVIGHVALGTFQSGMYSGRSAVFLHYVLESTYAVHIPVFFALSGYFFKPFSNYKNLFRRIYKRLISLGIPYLVFSIALTLLKMVGGNTVRNNSGFTGLLNIYWKPIDYLWFLFALFFVDIFVCLLSVFIRSKTVTMVVLVFVFIIATEFTIKIPAILYICLWAPFFYLGYLLRGVQISRWIAFSSFAVYLIHIPIFCKLNPNGSVLSGYWRIVSVLAVFMMFYFFQHHTGRDNNFFEWCGLGSLVIYLVHAPVLSVSRIILFKLGLSSLAVQLILQFLIGTFSAIFVLWLCNRNKLVDVIFRPTKYLMK